MMKASLIFAAVLYMSFAPVSAWASCVMVDDENARKTAEEAYFIGLVKTGYIHQWPMGYLKEAGLIPVLAYKADPAVKFDELIVVHNKQPGSCDAPMPRPYEFMEVLVVKTDGELQMRRLGHLQTKKTDQLMDELRSRARHVGPDHNIGWPKRKKQTENE